MPKAFPSHITPVVMMATWRRQSGQYQVNRSSCQGLSSNRLPQFLILHRLYRWVRTIGFPRLGPWWGVLASSFFLHLAQTSCFDHSATRPPHRTHGT